MNAKEHAIFFGDSRVFIRSLELEKYTQVFVLCDENTEKHCLPLITEALSPVAYQVVRVAAGERHKTLTTCQLVWEQLVRHGADRHSALINLGGGVVTDLGGFCAASYMRGIDFVHIPTSLLAQVDASIGGKTGIDFLAYKNLIGSFSMPRATCVDTSFLDTLPKRELTNGAVEVWKHALIADNAMWRSLCNQSFPESKQLPQLVKESVEIKQNIVLKDPLESGHRKLLNFGHTIGHALERLALSLNNDIGHGEAVAFGMIAASRLSQHYADLSGEERVEIEKTLFPYVSFLPEEQQVEEIINNIKLDKKNKSGTFLFTLLDKIGVGRVDVAVAPDDVRSAIHDAIRAVQELRTTNNT